MDKYYYLAIERGVIINSMGYIFRVINSIGLVDKNKIQASKLICEAISYFWVDWSHGYTCKNKLKEAISELVDNVSVTRALPVKAALLSILTALNNIENEIQ